jgi:predicted alpha/beta hydrolase family esterase
MARQVLFIQGAGEGVHDRWDSKLAASLERELGDGFVVRYPSMPGEDDPRYEPWAAMLAREFEQLEDGALLVGHSIGGTILIHMLAGQDFGRRFGGLFLIAPPFIGKGGWPSDDMVECNDFSERLPKGLDVFLYHGTGDDSVPISHLHRYSEALPRATVRILEGRDHQLDNDLTEVAGDIRAVA